jgi:O-methyltransferase involved in polyketide biosynthesis
MPALVTSAMLADAQRVVELYSTSADSQADNWLDDLVTTAARLSRSIVDADAADRARPMICEHRPERGSSMMCALDAGHSKVQGRRNEQAAWIDARGVKPDEVADENREYGWAKYRVVATPHSDLVVMWNDAGEAVNSDGSLI